MPNPKNAIALANKTRDFLKTLSSDQLEELLQNPVAFRQLFGMADNAYTSIDANTIDLLKQTGVIDEQS